MNWAYRNFSAYRRAVKGKSSAYSFLYCLQLYCLTVLLLITKHHHFDGRTNTFADCVGRTETLPAIWCWRPGPDRPPISGWRSDARTLAAGNGADTGIKSDRKAWFGMDRRRKGLRSFDRSPRWVYISTLARKSFKRGSFGWSNSSEGLFSSRHP